MTGPSIKSSAERAEVQTRRPSPRSMNPSTPPKFLRRLTSPVEILYDITQHWIIVLVLISLGTLVMLGQVASEAPTFECTATLVLSPQEVLAEGEPRSPAREKEGELRFIGEQLSLLLSDSVMEKVAEQRIAADRELPPREDKPEDRPGFVSRVYMALEGFLDGLFEAMLSEPEGTPAERRIQRISSSFRRRSYVLNERMSNIVKIGVLGPDRARLKEELQVWIDAYRSRIDELSQETYQRLFTDRTDYWIKEEAAAKEKLDQFKRDHPNVSAARQDWVRESVVKLKLNLDHLQRQFAGLEPLPAQPLPAAPAPAPRPADDLLTRLTARKDLLEIERAMLAAKVPLKSEKMKNMDLQIQNLKKEIGKLTPPPAVAAAQAQERGDDLSGRIKALTADLNQALAEQNSIEEKMAEMGTLLEDYRGAAGMRRKYQGLKERKIEQTESRKLVNVQLQDKPLASVVPLSHSPVLRVGLGAFSGASLGFLIAFTLECFSRRVRYKKDLEDDLGIRVVGVVREN